MRSRLIVVSPDLNRSGSQQKRFCERATGCTNTVSLRGVAHIVSLGLLNSITIQLRMSPRRGTTQPVRLVLDSAQARHGGEVREYAHLERILLGEILGALRVLAVKGW